MYNVSRQVQWPDGTRMVEVAEGGWEYSNPGLLVAVYPGEGEDYADPREAVRVALDVQRRWQAAAPDEVILVGYGATGGGTMPFEASTPEELTAWAAQAWEVLPKCDGCGEALPDNKRDWYENEELLADNVYCSDYCFQQAATAEQEYQIEQERDDLLAAITNRDYKWVLIESNRRGEPDELRMRGGCTDALTLELDAAMQDQLGFYADAVLDAAREAFPLPRRNMARLAG